MGTAATLEALKARHKPARTLSVSEALMEAARSIRHQPLMGDGPFSWERLVVTAWQMHPEHFGLPGYRHQYPDSNRVSAALYGSRGLIKRGLIRRVGPKLFKLED